MKLIVTLTLCWSFNDLTRYCRPPWRRIRLGRLVHPVRKSSPTNHTVTPNPLITIHKEKTHSKLHSSPFQQCAVSNCKTLTHPCSDAGHVFLLHSLSLAKQKQDKNETKKSLCALEAGSETTKNPTCTVVENRSSYGWMKNIRSLRVRFLSSVSLLLSLELRRSEHFRSGFLLTQILHFRIGFFLAQILHFHFFEAQFCFGV